MTEIKSFKMKNHAFAKKQESTMTMTLTMTEAASELGGEDECPLQFVSNAVCHNCCVFMILFRYIISI